VIADSRRHQLNVPAEAAHRVPVKSGIDRLLAQQNFTPRTLAFRAHYDGHRLSFLQTDAEKRPIRAFFFDDPFRTDKRAGINGWGVHLS
jgi:hypothetical protein